jgi:hypothetical protein
MRQSVAAFPARSASTRRKFVAGADGALGVGRREPAVLAPIRTALHVALDHDCKYALVSLTSGGIGNRRTGLRSRPYCLLDVFDREVRPHDRLLMSRQRLPDADQTSVRLR